MNNAIDELVTQTSSIIAKRMSPDPRHSEISGPVSGSDVPSVNFLQLEDSDSDASPEDDGYELLNANELDNYDDDEPVHNNHFSLNHPNETNLFEPPTTRTGGSSDDEGMEDPSSSVDKSSCQLSQDQSEVIKSVMKGIKLPESAVPSWASVIPEEKWKSMLDSKINGKSSSSSDN